MGCRARHLQQQPAMAEPANVRRPIRPLPITNGHLDNLQILLGRAKEQIEVSKGIEVTEVSAIGGDSFVVLFPQNLRSAQGIFDRLA